MLKNILILIVMLTANPNIVLGSELTVTVTAFALKGEKTSLQTVPKVGHTVAVSRDMKHLLGKRIYIQGHGIRTVESLTHKKLRRTIDVYVASNKIAMKIGKSKKKIIVKGDWLYASH